MAKTAVVTVTYAGGGATPAQSSVTSSGNSEFNESPSITASATTTLAPSIVMTPSTRVRAYSFQVAGGNATLAFGDATGGFTTIGLTDSVPVINYTTDATIPIALLPTGASTYTLSVRNANTVTLTSDLRMVLA